MSITERIEQMYCAWLEAKGYQQREGQLRMIGFIDRVLQSKRPRIGVVEAGTGTGKTIAYATSAVPIGKEQGKRVVIVTATVALQDQITGKDLPELRTLTDIPFTYVLAKGRRRYVCPRRLSHSANATSAQVLDSLAEVNTTEREVGRNYVELFDSFVHGNWTGDIDHSPVAMSPRLWQPITTDARGCINNVCEWYSRCPYFKARAQFADVDVVVTNYDLLLSHLRIESDILPAAEDCIYVLDEAHHLAPKTMDAFSKSFGLIATESLLRDVNRGMVRLLEQLDDPDLLKRYVGEFSHANDLYGNLCKQLHKHIANLEFRDDREGTRRCRFEYGEVPPDIQAIAAQLAKVCQDIAVSIERVAGWLKEQGESNQATLGGNVSLDVLDELTAATQHFDEARELLLDFGYAEHGSVCGRWIEHITHESREEWRLKSVPIEISEILSDKLWNRASATIFTSATLNAGDDFRHFMSSVGLEESKVALLALDSPFDFQKAVEFCVPKMTNEPAAGEGQSYSDEVARVLPKLLELEQSALVLFTSRSMMESVSARLPERVRRYCMVQSASGRHALLEEHRKRIDSRKSSYIFGLASYREGIDLPGAYCRHVIVTRLPFDVPTDPIVESKKELLQKSGIEGYQLFLQLQVPEATLKLVQACGRLIRNEHDWGRITVLDRRIVTKHYGKQMLEALPNYRRVIQ